jgi:acyl-CoA thioesterase II
MHEGFCTRLEDLLVVEEVGPGRYRGGSPQGTASPVFGGQVVAQALAAATRSAPPGRAAHSLHAYFLASGDPGVPFDYRVEHLREGRSFTTSRVTASQHDRDVFSATVQFTTPATGPSHCDPMPAVPGPEAAQAQTPLHLPKAGGEGETWPWGEPIELRWVTGGPDAAARNEARHQAWFRWTEAVADSPHGQAGVLAYASDLTLLVVAIAPHDPDAGGFGPPSLLVGSLDHAVWFHEAARADEWMLYDQSSHWAGGGRAIATGRIWSRDGRLLATVAQEGFVRFRAGG